MPIRSPRSSRSAADATHRVRPYRTSLSASAPARHRARAPPRRIAALDGRDGLVDELSPLAVRERGQPGGPRRELGMIEGGLHFLIIGSVRARRLGSSSTHASTHVSIAAIALAAGAGVRMGAGMPKALLPVAGRPLMCWSLDALAASPDVDRVVLVVPDGCAREVEMAVGGPSEGMVIVAGGATRAQSVAAGLAATSGADGVLVHDTARPLLTPGLVSRVLEGVEGVDGALAASPLTDTLKRAGDGLVVAATVDRMGLWRAETPQAFVATRLHEAIAAADREGRIGQATDCASLVEAIGGVVRLVPSGMANPKLTTPADMELIERLLAGPSQ